MLWIEKKKETDKRFDKRFDNAIDRFETMGNLIEDQVECIAKLEAKQNNVAAKLDEIEASIRIFDDEIEAIEKKKDAHYNESEANNTNIKICKFNNFGFCKTKDKCVFYHAETICETYEKHNFCNKMFCRKRHPKV